MSDFNEVDFEDIDEDNADYITLTDDDGNDISFEILDTIEYNERLFAVLLPFDETDDEVVILEIIPGEEPESDDFISVDDEKLLGEVFEEFKKKNKDEFDFA